MTSVGLRRLSHEQHARLAWRPGQRDRDYRDAAPRANSATAGRVVTCSGRSGACVHARAVERT